MKERLTYEAPLARDLSAFGASGQNPLGCATGFVPSGGPGEKNCYVGISAAGNCTDGSNPGGSCSGGYGVTGYTDCGAGGSATGYCSTGSGAASSGCNAGSVP